MSLKVLVSFKEKAGNACYKLKSNLSEQAKKAEKLLIREAGCRAHVQKHTRLLQSLRGDAPFSNDSNKRERESSKGHSASQSTNVTKYQAQQFKYCTVYPLHSF